MELSLLYGIAGVACFLFALYNRKDNSIDLKKETTTRPVIKFRLYQVKKIADKASQTTVELPQTPPPSPMSEMSTSSDFPFDFTEGYYLKERSV